MYTCTAKNCGKHFSFSGPFDDHRTGDHAKRQRTCKTTEEMVAAGWTTTSLKNGTVIWHPPIDKDLGEVFDKTDVFEKVRNDEPAA